MKRKLFLIPVLLILFAFTSDKPAYNIFSKTGKIVNYSEMIQTLKGADIVFFGELHNNPIDHWLELEITKELYKIKKKSLVLGAEMFESDNQLIINEYLKDLIPHKKFADEAKLWPNYSTDYKPLLEFAKEKNLHFIATNIPRRYASVVYKNGGLKALEKLTPEAKNYIAPLPIEYGIEESKIYTEMFNGIPMGGGKKHMPKNKGKSKSPNSKNPSFGKPVNMMNMPIAQSQAAKDATMAHFIYKNRVLGNLFLHFNGALHSDNFEGITRYLRKINKNLKILTISTVLQKDVQTLETKNLKKANFIINISESMTTSY